MLGGGREELWTLKNVPFWLKQMKMFSELSILKLQKEHSYIAKGMYIMP